MNLSLILIYYTVLSLKYIGFARFMASAHPVRKSDDNVSMKSVSTVSSVLNSIANSAKGSSTTNGSVTLDFNASQVSSDILVNTSIPGVIKYSGNNNKKINKILCNGSELNFTKEIDYVLSNSPFNGNITVVFKDASSEQYVLKETGFERYTPPNQSSSQTSTNLEDYKFLELDLINPTDGFLCQEVGNIKCYKPKGSRELVSKIIISNTNREVEHRVKENFICYTEENGKYSILVAYLDNENKWLKYTLSKQPTTNILMDVSLMRTFDDIDIPNIFADHSTPYDNEVFTYENLNINKNVGVMRSETTGNLKFILEFKDELSTVVQTNIVFEKHFVIDEGFTFHSITSNANYDQMLFTYVNDNVVHYEKYVKKGDVYKKDLTAVNKHDLNRTKKIINREDIQVENVLFYKTIVPDALHQGLKISHHGKFKVVDFDKGKERFVIFPNMEFYLNKDEHHRLILCENGDTVSLVMKTTSNSKRVDYIASTDQQKGNPLAIKSLLMDLDVININAGVTKHTDDITLVAEPQTNATQPSQHSTPSVKTVHQPQTQIEHTASDDELEVVEGPMSGATPTVNQQQQHQNNQNDDDMPVVVGAPILNATSPSESAPVTQTPMPAKRSDSSRATSQSGTPKTTSTPTTTGTTSNDDDDDEMTVVEGNEWQRK